LYQFSGFILQKPKKMFVHIENSSHFGGAGVSSLKCRSFAGEVRRRHGWFASIVGDIPSNWERRNEFYATTTRS
jgi:hypothetical protein